MDLCLRGVVLLRLLRVRQLTHQAIRSLHSRQIAHYTAGFFAVGLLLAATACGGGGGTPPVQQSNMTDPPPVQQMQQHTTVATYHNNNARTGLNPTESALTPGNVNDILFGRRAAIKVQGDIFAQPLYVPGVMTGGSFSQPGYRRHRARPGLRHRC